MVINGIRLIRKNVLFSRKEIASHIHRAFLNKKSCFHRSIANRNFNQRKANPMSLRDVRKFGTSIRAKIESSSNHIYGSGFPLIETSVCNGSMETRFLIEKSSVYVIGYFFSGK
ncbi:hypothetical protein DM860_015931 [Cuscuta australis]|uniref:Uncharacterized protein n=1 Tax=Cuscuta australis TaxID=267555 RepID=A0A328DYH3_9ASTE|nr:hypothetical protein DM860_015931 [Cuscuta australis]